MHHIQSMRNNDTTAQDYKSDEFRQEIDCLAPSAGHIPKLHQKKIPEIGLTQSG